ncbi:MAG: ABC transporter ATP-binding protein [Salinivirgaceae bacterium]
MVSTQSHIALKNLSVGYRLRGHSRVVIPNIDLRAAKGTLIALVGANGSGKSTLLRTLVGLQPTLGGEITIGNKPLENFNRPELAKTLSFVGTHYDMHAMMRVHQVVSYGRYPYTNMMGRMKEHDRHIIRKAMHDTGIFHLRDAFISEISDGEKQRVLIARSLAQDTEIILLDEPTAYLDVKNKFEILHLLGRLAHEKQKIIIFSSHDLQIVLGTVDLLWFIDKKSIIQGMPEELVLRNKINDLFRHSEVYFDAEENEFKINRKHYFNMRLEGTGAFYKWTQKALNRMHIGISNQHAIGNIQILEKQNDVNWKATINNQSKTFESLQEMIAWIYLQQKT